MSGRPEQISLREWDRRAAALRAEGRRGPPYDGPLSRHVEEGDVRLCTLKFDSAPASLDLWNFLLTEEDRLRDARERGCKLVGTMKDLGTVPVMAYALPNTVAFYPDGAWWIPCIMELHAGLLDMADSLGVDDSFCPVRAMLGAFESRRHFPIPDLLTCSVGATCDDFSAVAQRLEGLGYPVMWWEIPHRRPPCPGEQAVPLPGGFEGDAAQVELVARELARIRTALETLTGDTLDDTGLREGIVVANRVRRQLDELRRSVFLAEVCPLPALEMLIAEMLAIHFCSDREETLRVLDGLTAEVRRRVSEGTGYFGADAVRLFWVNPVADLQVMNLLEECGGRICGTDYLFTHALDEIPTDLPPMEALARTALADPMVGSASDRAARVSRDALRFGAEAVVVSRIPGASHCALEGAVIGDTIRDGLGLPVLDIEVPPVSDAMRTTLRTRLQALVETVEERRKER